MGTEAPSHDIAAMADAFRIAEYDTYFQSHPPYSPPEGHEEEGYDLDRHATLVKNRWVYPIVSLVSGEKVDGNAYSYIPFEARVDESGVVMRAVPATPPTVPIPERPDVFVYDPDHPYELDLSQKVDAKGRALMVRLFLSPFRLPKKAIELLCNEAYHDGARAHIPSLWEWSKTAISPVVAADGWRLVDRRTVLTVDGKPTRVWVGVDPFRVARRRSDLYVQARKKYVEVFEPKHGEAKKHWEKIQFLKLLDEALVTNDSLPDKYKKALDIGRINEEITDYKKRESKARGLVTERVRALVDVLESPFFSLLQYASLQAEGWEDAEYSEALVEHIVTLNHVLRQIDEVAEGVLLLRQWVEESEKSETHFLNQFVFPPRPLADHTFRTVRWISKGTLGLIKDLYPRIIGHLKRNAGDVADALHRLGIVESGDAARGLLNAHTLDVRETAAALGVSVHPSSFLSVGNHTDGGLDADRRS